MLRLPKNAAMSWSEKDSLKNTVQKRTMQYRVNSILAYRRVDIGCPREKMKYWLAPREKTANS